MIGLRVRLLVGLAVLAAVGLVSASASSGGGPVGGGRLGPRTLAVLPHRIFGLVADGRRLAWWIAAEERLGCELKIQILDVPRHRLTTLRPDLNCEVPTILGTALAGTRVVFGEGSSSFFNDYGSVGTVAVGERRVRWLANPVSEHDSVASAFGFPVRVAGGGGTLAFLTLTGKSWGQLSPELWRVVGRKAVPVPYQPAPLAALAVEGRLLATSNWVVAEGQNWSPAFSPDGREIAWNHAGTLWLMGADASGQRPLSTAGAARVSSGSSWYPSAPCWSPDSATLAFDSGDAIVLIDRDGSDQRRLVEGSSPAWSPDGTSLAFERGGDLWLIGAAGDNERRLVTGVSHKEGWQEARSTWSPDGTMLAFVRGGDIYIGDVESGAERDLTPGERVEQSPAWSPDGTRIAFERTPNWEADEPGSIYTIRPDGSDLREIIRSDTAEVLMPAWSPDGQRLAYQADIGDGEGTTEIRVVNADGSDPKTLGGYHSWGAPTWSPDGSVIAAGDSLWNGYWTSGIVAFDPAGGRKERRLAAPTNPAGVELRNIRNGKLLRTWELGASALWLSDRYLVARTARTCRRYSLASGKELGSSPCRHWADLSLSHERAAYRIGRRVYQLDLKSGHSTLLAVAARSPVGPVLERNRLVWAEAYRKGTRIREIVLP